jgi:alcohol dehydrogenase
VRGLVLDGVGRIAYRTDLPEPTIEAPTDVVVAVSRAGLCGSDLHPYEGREPVRFGVVAGHELVGEVVAVGGAVAAVGRGDRVRAAFTTSCGRCASCRRGLTARCVRGALFGFAPADDPKVPALHGGQAELVRVPLADTTLVHVPPSLDDTAAVLLTDNLPTAWCAVERADPEPDEPLIVVGLGAVGLCAAAVAVHAGAPAVLAVDPVPARRAAAARLGVHCAAPEDAADVLAAIGADEGAAAVVDAAGGEAAQALAAGLVRPGGRLSVIAVQTGTTFGFSPVDAYDRNLTVLFGRASVRAALDRMLPDAVETARLLADVVITDPDVDLVDGPATYRRFARRADGTIKAVFAP